MFSDLQSIATNIWSVFLIILFFGGTIFVHELGHFLAARRRGVKVARFSIGFGPKIFSWMGKDGVEYRVSWLPLGGYVALPQLADMSMIEGEAGAEYAKLPPPSYSTKLLVFVAGAVFNVLFAFLLACIVWIAGLPGQADLNTTKVGLVLPTITLPNGSTMPSPAFTAGFQPGDVITAIDGKRVASWPDLQQTLVAGSGRSADGRPKAVVTIERAGKTMKLTVFPRLAGEEHMRFIGIAPAEELVIGTVDPGRLGAKVGLQSNDRITAYDSTPLLSRDQFVQYLHQNRNRDIKLEIARGSRTLTLTLPPRPDRKDISDLGIQRLRSMVVTHPSPFQQINDDVVMTFRGLIGLINPRSDLKVSQLTGPIGIAQGFLITAQTDIRLVLWLTILVNVNLAIINLLPIPVFDGGHILFATIDRLRGRALPVNFIMTTQSVFIVLIFSFFLYISFFDVRRIVHDARTDQSPAATTQPVAAPPSTP